MSTANYLHYIKSFCVVLILGLFTSNTLAQDASNKRGFQPGNSFSIGDFETINTTNGNLMFKFPLAGLPAGRNGLTAGINLYYSSKVLDSEIRYFDKVNSCVHNSPDCPYYQKLLLKESDQGGWHFGMGYSLKIIDRREEFVYVPIELQPTCSTEDPRYFEMRYHIKLILNMPDGSTHEMRPNGWSDGNFNDPLGDYFEISPDGLWSNCHTSQWYTNTITYYSIDGSFLRLDIQHDGNTAGGWQDNPWTLYFPDGSKVTTNQPNNEPQRFYDRNNNYVEFDGNTIRDQFNRSISISNGTQNGVPVQNITSQGFGESLTWTIHWKTIGVNKNYWPCQDRFACDPEILQQEPYFRPRAVVDTITMPAQAGGLTYTFTYNAPNYVPGQPMPVSEGWGEINGVTLPSGAHIDYEYFQDGSQPDSATPDILRNSPTSKVLTYNQEYDGTSTPATEIWSYEITPFGSSVTAPDEGTTTTNFFDTSAASWSSGLTYKSVGPDGTKTETIWARNELASGIASNSYPKTVFTSIKNASGMYVKTAIKDYKYDKNGNVTRVAEYDWVNYQDVSRDGQDLPIGIPNVSPTRVTVNTYYNSTPDATQFAGSNTNVYWSSGSPRVKSAIASTEARRIVAGGAEDPVTRVEYTYDNAAAPANLTQTRTWDSTKGIYTSSLTAGNSLAATMQYNQYGMPTLVTDPRGLKTLTTYGQIGTVSDLYPTQIKAAYQSSEERTQTREYDFATGLSTRVTDNDNNVSTVTSFDALGRPVLVRAAEGKPEETRTAMEYSEAARRVITRSDLSTVGDGKIVSIQHYDQLGRIRLTRQLEDAAQNATDETTGIKVQTRYRYSGTNSFVLVSNPYRAATSNVAGSETTMGWSRSKSDNAGRTIEVQTFGGATLPAPWGSSTISTGTVTTAYDAHVTTVTDQAQKTRRSVTDGLGRLIRVDEPDLSSNLGTTTSPAQPTDYAYDILGNLTHVTQSNGSTTQNRDFTYSSLSLLMASTQPDSGSSSFKYDANGNLIVKTDARNVSIHYAYDALNRVTRRWYNGSNSDSATTHNSPALPSGVGATDEVKFYYDSQSLPQGAPTYTREYTAGRVVAQTYATGTNGDYFSYDALGRTKLKYQQTGTVNYRMSADYNQAGEVKSLTYPSDHTITNSLDTAGRLLAVAGNIGDGANRTYTSGILYTPSGGLTKEQFGTDTAVYNKQFYNSRAQLAEIRASTSYTGPTDYSADRGAIVNVYSSQCSGICLGSSMTDNNGNLKKQEIHIPNQQMRWQQFEYDSLNRLSSAREVLDGGAEQWKQQFVYDRWGNRTIDSNVTYGGINEKGFTVDTTNNRLGVPAGQSGVMNYDLAGNLTNDTYTGNGNRTYDAENRITSAWGGNNQAQLYGYDGSGQRIKRTVDGVTTWQVYGFSGELIGEYPANGTATNPQKEYGYRNGQLLITAAPGSGGSTPSGLVGNWKFDENSGTTAADSSGNSNTGTLTSGAAWTTGQSGAATNLDGVDDYVQVGAQSSLVMTNACTLSAWIYPTGAGSLGAYGGIIMNKEGEYEVARFADGTIQWAFANTNPGWNWVNTGYVAPLNQWTHVAVTYDSGVVKTYINGTLVHTYSGSGAIGDVESSLNDFRVGGRQVASHHFQGRIDEARVYNRALSASEVTTLLPSPPTSGLAAKWKFDENSGTTAADSSGNSNTGTLSSGAAWTTGQSGAATNLDGVDDYVQVGAQSSLVMTNACTLSAWIYPTGAGSLGAYGGIIVNKEGEYEVARFADGTIQWAFANTNPGWNWVNTGYVAPLNQWTHVAVTYDSGVVKTYINGTLRHTYSGSGSIGDVESSLNDFRVGGRQVASHHFQGRIDEVKVYNRALSASEVPALPSGAGSSSSSAQINWLVPDQLGTPRMVIDQTGSLANVKRHDYLPFGEELFAPYHGRTTSQGYEAGDGIRQQFTSKERDVETGLDYFGARYYSSVQGRFTSVDPDNAGASLADPQSWNGYSYTLNNPLRFIDPDGLRWAQVTVDGGIYYDWFDDVEKDDNGETEYDRALKAGFSAVDFDESKDFTYANGLFAPGEKITTVKLSPDGKFEVTQHTVTLEQWAVVAIGIIGASTDMSTYPHQRPAAYMARELILSVLSNGNSNISIDAPDVPGPAVGSRSRRPSGGLEIDATGKVHGKLPKSIPKKWTREQLEDSAASLRKSISNRKAEQLRLGEDGPHRLRIFQEEKLLRQIEKKLSGS